MSLTDISFLFIFLPLTLLACTFRGSVKIILLVIASLFFYSCGTPQYMLYIAIMMCIDISLANAIQSSVCEKKNRRWMQRIFLVAGIIVNAAFLLLFKFVLADQVLPLGISVFTFKAISLFVDIYKRKIVVSQNPLKIILYMLFFGQIISGPMTRYDEFFGQSEMSVTEPFFKNTLDNIECGSFYFVRGFAKKTVFANIMKIIADETFSGQAPNAAISFFWLGSVAFTLQIYYDFSGYSDMAKGISNVFGLGCADNFDHPLCSKSISEFWRRWHMSLGTWLRDYVYIPLGGSAKGALRTLFNLLTVWILTAIWHGAGMTFMAWGLINFAAVASEKLILKPIAAKIDNTGQNILSLPPFLVIKHLFVVMFLLVQWVVFNSSDITSCIDYLRNMFCFTGDLIDTRTIILCKEYGVFIAFAILFTMPVADRVCEMISRKGKIIGNIYGILCGLILSGLFLIGLSLVVSGQNDPFLYGGF